jgi:hypothetical protein
MASEAINQPDTTMIKKSKSYRTGLKYTEIKIVQSTNSTEPDRVVQLGIFEPAVEDGYFLPLKLQILSGRRISWMPATSASGNTA